MYHQNGIQRDRSMDDKLIFHQFLSTISGVGRKLVTIKGPD